jgi:transcriptional regulator with XRE-family HTH domain
MSIYEEIGHKITKAREESNLTQEEMAKRLGCTQATLSNYELGKRRLYISNLEQIAAILHKPLSYFIEISPNHEKPKLINSLDDLVIRDIVLALADLPQCDKELVLDFVRWRKGNNGRSNA